MIILLNPRDQRVINSCINLVISHYFNTYCTQKSKSSLGQHSKHSLLRLYFSGCLWSVKDSPLKLTKACLKIGIKKRKKCIWKAVTGNNKSIWKAVTGNKICISQLVTGNKIDFNIGQPQFLPASGLQKYLYTIRRCQWSYKDFYLGIQFWKPFLFLVTNSDINNCHSPTQPQLELGVTK